MIAESPPDQRRCLILWSPSSSEAEDQDELPLPLQVQGLLGAWIPSGCGMPHAARPNSPHMQGKYCHRLLSTSARVLGKKHDATATSNRQRLNSALCLQFRQPHLSSQLLRQTRPMPCQVATGFFVAQISNESLVSSTRIQIAPTTVESTLRHFQTPRSSTPGQLIASLQHFRPANPLQKNPKRKEKPCPPRV